MRLFDDIPRTHQGIAAPNEDTFSFLDRSAWRESESVRESLGVFFRRYPKEARAELKSKFRSQFTSAFTELFLHDLLLRLGCEITVHPVLGETASRPDFLARFPHGEEIIVEAVLVTELSNKERARNARLNALYDTIERNVKSPNFWLCLGPVFNPDAVPAHAPIWKFIKKRIAHLDPNVVAEASSNAPANALPKWTYRHADGFELEICVIPKSPEYRNNPEIRAIGAFPGQARWGGSGSALREAITGKAKKYGSLAKPFIVAVNTVGAWGTERDDLVEALYGAKEPMEKSDAVWNPTKNKRLSGVLVTKAWPLNIQSADLCLYHNPFATRPCVELPWKISQSFRRDSGMQWREGIKSAELFQLSDN